MYVLFISFTLMLNGCDTTHAWIVYKEKTKWNKKHSVPSSSITKIPRACTVVFFNWLFFPAKFEAKQNKVIQKIKIFPKDRFVSGRKKTGLYTQALYLGVYAFVNSLQICNAFDIFLQNNFIRIIQTALNINLASENTPLLVTAILTIN